MSAARVSLTDMSARVYVIHENPQWLPPFEAAFEAEGVPLQE